MNKDIYQLNKGEGRTRVSLTAHRLGDDLAVFIYNDKAHIGAVAVGEYDHAEQRASVSVITRLGHKDDALARSAALAIARHTKKPVSVIAGVHVDDITGQEIDAILKNAALLLEKFIKTMPA
ncbi:hypothetical protein ACFLU4_06600 [Chloroflexota bacterium]